MSAVSFAGVPALRNVSFRRLIGAQAMSQLGDWLYNVALLALVFDRTHSAAWLGATTAARVLPIVLLGPVAGLLGDRLDRRVVMVVSDVIRAVAMIALIAAVSFGLPVWFIPALAALATAAGAPYPSCAAATIARLLAKASADERTAANSVRAAVGPLAIVTGPLVGAALVAAGGPVFAFAANAATFALSALLTVAVPDRQAFRPAGNAEREPGLWAGLTTGARELVRHREAARLIGADVLCSFVYGVETVVLVALSMRLGWHESGYGVLIGAVGVGGLFGTAAATRLVRLAGRRAVIVGALVAVGASLPLMALAPRFGLVALLVLANGAGSLIVEICTETVLQEALPEEVFARAYGFAFPVSIAGIAAGSIAAAPLVAALGIAGGLSVVGAAVAGYGLWLLGVRRPIAVVAVGLVAGTLVAVSSTEASAATDGGPVTFSYANGDTQTYTVPDGVYEVRIDLTGGSGGNGVSTLAAGKEVRGGTGGYGGTVSEVVATTPGQTITIDLGGAGSSPNDPSCFCIANGGSSPSGRTGGNGGAGSIYYGIWGASGGGGGGASEALLDGSAIAVAGGGGGGGGVGAGLVADQSGGRGGDAGHWGSDAGSGAGGGPGLRDAVTGEDGSFAEWFFLSGSGGGGGGGWYGGHTGYAAWDGGGGGGGAGGSNWASAADAELGYATTMGDGSATITPVRLDPRMTITADPSTVLNNNAVTIAVGVGVGATYGSGSGPKATGTVTFTDTSTGLEDDEPVFSNGYAVWTSDSFAVGRHVITARYNGDSTYLAANTDGSAAFTVLQGDNSDQISPTSLTWGNEPINYPTDRTAEVTNTGNTPWRLYAVLTPPGSSFYYDGGNCEDGPIVVGGTCSIEIAWRPNTHGDTHEQAIVESTTGTQTIDLTGTGVDPNPQLSVSGDFDFGDVVAGATGTKTVILHNTGNTPLREHWSYTVDQSSSGGGDVTMDNSSTCGTDLTLPVLQPGDSCDLTLDFDASQVGQFSATVNFAGDVADQVPLHVHTAAVQHSASLSTSTLSFGPIAVGKSETRQVTLTNTGNVDWAASGMSTDNGDINMSNTTCFDAVLHPGDACTMDITFTPTSRGEDDGTIAAFDADSSLETDLAVTGRGVVSSATLSEQSLSFGDQEVGTHASKTITVTNTGDVDWSVSASNPTGPVATNGTCLQAPTAPQSTCTLVVAYAPTTGGEADGSVVLMTSSGTITVPVTGFGTVRSATVDHSSLDFGSLVVGTSASKTVTITNTGNRPWSSSGATSTTPQFNVTAGTCSSGAIAPNATCTFVTSFRPDAAGTRSGTITISSTSGPIKITAQSIGIAAHASQTVTPTSAALRAFVGAAATKTVTVTNNGNVPWTFTSAHVSGSAALSVTGGTCAAQHSVPAGHTCTIKVAYAPTAAGHANATLVVGTSAGTSNVAISLTGVAQHLAASTSALNFGKHAIGTTTARTVTIRNAGSIAWTLSKLTVGAQYQVTNTTCGTGLTAGATCTVTVAFRPTKTGPHPSTLRITGSFPTLRVSLLGRATRS